MSYGLTVNYLVTYIQAMHDIQLSAYFIVLFRYFPQGLEEKKQDPQPGNVFIRSRFEPATCRFSTGVKPHNDVIGNSSQLFVIESGS